MEKTINEVVRKLKAIPPAPEPPPVRMVKEDRRPPLPWLSPECPHCGDVKLSLLDKAVLAILVLGPLLMLGGAIVHAWRG